MLKKSASIIAASSLLALVGTALASTAAVAAEPVEACSVWHQGDTYNVSVQKTAERTYSVTITDFMNYASPSSTDNSYVPLPLEPVDLRLSHNMVKLNPALSVSDISISQSVETGPAAEDPGHTIVAYKGLAPAPWENASLNGNEIVWAQDMDARTDENHNMVRPDDYSFPMHVVDDSAGVLEFTVTVPDDISGEVSLFDGMSVNYMSAKITVPGDVWEADIPQVSEFPGCAVTIDAVPETKPEPKPEPEVTKPTVKEPLANTGAGDSSLLIGIATAAAVAGGTIALLGRRQKKTM